MGIRRRKSETSGCMVTLLRYLLFRPKRNGPQPEGDRASLDQIRKLVASGVACIEQHGAPPRGYAVDRNGFKIL